MWSGQNALNHRARSSSGHASHRMKRYEETEDDGTIYTIGTSILGTKTQQEDSISGYAPVVCVKYL